MICTLWPTTHIPLYLSISCHETNMIHLNTKHSTHTLMISGEDTREGKYSYQTWRFLWQEVSRRRLPHNYVSSRQWKVAALLMWTSRFSFNLLSVPGTARPHQHYRFSDRETSKLHKHFLRQRYFDKKIYFRGRHKPPMNINQHFQSSLTKIQSQTWYNVH